MNTFNISENYLIPNSYHSRYNKTHLNKECNQGKILKSTRTSHYVSLHNSDKTKYWEGWLPKSAILSVSSNTSVNIRIAKSKEFLTLQSLFVSFFPYDEEVLSIIKSINRRHWDADTREWELPVTKLEELQYALNGFKMTVEGTLEKECNIITDEFKFKTEPFSHQIEAFNYGNSHCAWLLGDEQGLGKTKSIIDIACYRKQKYGYKHCLIICAVNGLKWNWRNEIATHSNETCWILGQRMKKKLTVCGNKEKLEDIHNIDNIDDYFIITNVETLRDSKINDELVKLCKSKTINMVAVDEIHIAKNPSSQQGKALLKLQPEYRVAMSGTPLMNTPLDLYLPLKWLGYETHSFFAFKNFHCIMGGFGGHEIVGYKNLDIIQDTLSEMMLRRLKEEVLDLPDKLFVDEYVEMTPKQSIIYKEIINDMRLHIDKIVSSPNPLSELIRLRQATGYTGILSTEIKESAKINRLKEIVDETVSEGKKVVIFSNWTKMIEPIVDKLSSHKPLVITGEVNTDDRNERVNTFQNDDSRKVIVGTIGAMGTGLTLTAGTTVVFLDEAWTMAAKNQAIDRCHRIGTKSNVTVYTIMCKDTIDERIHSIVEKKGELADNIVDGKVIENKEEIVRFLLS